MHDTYTQWVMEEEEKMMPEENEAVAFICRQNVKKQPQQLQKKAL